MKNSGHRSPRYLQDAQDQALLKGLKDLETWDVRQEFHDFNGPKLILASKQDAIIPEKLTIASFGDDVIWYKEGNHLLGLNEVTSVSQHIRRFVETHS